MVFDSRSSAAALLLMVMAVSAQVHAGEAGSDPAFRAVEPNMNLGRVVAGNTATGTFIFQNDGDVDVRIVRAKPS